MGEVVDILNHDGSYSGTSCLKREAHRLGYLHPTVHIWIYTKDGYVLIQKRTASKKTFPNLWDVSVAGHISNGESIISSALREIEEEIGLSPCEERLEKIGTHEERHVHSEEFIDHELHHVFLLSIPSRNVSLELQKEEVSEVKFAQIQDLILQITKDSIGSVYVPHDINYYKWVLREIEERLTDK